MELEQAISSPPAGKTAELSEIFLKFLICWSWSETIKDVSEVSLSSSTQFHVLSDTQSLKLDTKFSVLNLDTDAKHWTGTDYSHHKQNMAENRVFYFDRELLTFILRRTYNRIITHFKYITSIPVGTVSFLPCELLWPDSCFNVLYWEGYRGFMLNVRWINCKTRYIK